MTSITTHKYSPSANNKENESCNGKRVDVTRSNTAGSKFDWVKQEAISQQRKLRLTQVRQQSKDIATQFRENVRSEEKRQLDKVNETKRNEMLNWRQKQMGLMDKNYKSCMEHVGEAHLAAERETEKQQKIDEQKEKNRRLALKRGKLAAQTLKSNLKLNKTKDNKIQCKKAAPKIVEISDESDDSTSSTSSSDSSICSVITNSRKSGTENKSKVAMVQNKSNTLPKRSPLKVKWSTKTPDYDPSRFTSINSSTATDVSLTDSPMSDPPPVITKVSQLLQKTNPTDPRVAKTYKLTNSPNKPNTVKPVQKPIKNKISTISSRFNKSPSKINNRDKSGLNKVTDKKHFVPEFVKSKSPFKSSSFAQPSSSLRQKVQYYDHSNRFLKEYDGAIGLEKEVHESVPYDAWQEAKQEIQRQKVTNNSTLGMRKLEGSRNKITLDKENIRKEYEMVSKDMQKMLQDERMSKKLDQSREKLSESRSLSDTNAIKGRLPECDNSFLLDFVTARTNKICDDIERCRMENGKSLNQCKIGALHGLLSKVNSLRRILFEELKQNGENRIDADEILSEISRVEQEQNEIMTGKSPQSTNRKGEKRERSLNERERVLKMKEKCIEEKVRELYLAEKEMEQKKKLDKITSHEKKLAAKPSGATGKVSADEAPVQIVINVNKGDKMNTKSTDVIVNDVKWSERLKKSTQSAIEVVTTSNVNKKVYPKTPAIKTKSVIIERKQLDSASQSTSLTTYMSPPELIQTQLTKALQQGAMKFNTQTTKENTPQINDRELLQYIMRLLGMSRISVEQLDMSSVSTVRTPNSSVINVSSNRKFTASSTSTPASLSSSCSMEKTESIEKNKLQQLARFLAENRNFLDEAQNRNPIDKGVWNDILSRQKDDINKPENGIAQTTLPNDEVISQEHPTNSEENVANNDQISKYDEMAANCAKRIINLDSMIAKVRTEKLKLLENTLSPAGSLLTQSQKDNITEYLDLPGQQANPIAQQNNDDHTLPLSDSKSTNAASSEFSTTSGTVADTTPNDNRANLTRNKEFGESKDSGVGISRPVTSSDYRESPDLRQNAKTNDSELNKKLLSLALRESKSEEQFEPFLKDIPKISYRIGSENPEPLIIPNLQLEMDSQSAANNRDKTSKPPPAALTRYSPQMEEEMPHELSTITEVDTPATSRLNATDITCNNDPATKYTTLKTVPDNELLKFLYNQFPNFRDYIKSNDNPTHFSTGSLNESTEVTAAASVILGEKLEKLLDIDLQAECLKYKQFTSNTATTSNEWNDPEMAYAKFPSHSQYAKTTSGLLDSRSIDQIDLSDDSSLPDIPTELKARNIIEHSFEGVTDNEGSFKDLLIIPSNKRKLEQTAKDVEKQSNSLSETLERDLNSIGLNWASTILRKSKEITTSTSSDSSTYAERSKRSSQKSNSPRKIKSTKRPTTGLQMNQARDSFFEENSMLNEKEAEASNVTSQRTDDVQMKSMNLKEFLARELLKHSSMSSTSTDSSLASLFLKSFLEPSNNSSKLSETPPNRGTDKHRTSTPLQNSSESKGDSKVDSSVKSSTAIHNLSKDDAGTVSAVNDLSKFFSGESHLSSVRLSSADSTSSDERHRQI